MNPLLHSILHKEGISAIDIQPLSGGQVNRVFRIGREYVLRLGERADAFQRLQRETELIRQLSGCIPLPQIVAFGQQEGVVYQIQRFVCGDRLYSIWKDLSPRAQNQIVEELASYLRTLHAIPYTDFGCAYTGAPRTASWQEFITARFNQTLGEITAIHIQVLPGILELASEHFARHQGVLQGGTPVLVHGDLWLGNILVENERISAILDLEYAIQAPPDYELLKMEDFCLYPNDYAEEENDNYCAADFAGFFQLMRKVYPELFAIEHARERLDLYHLLAALSDYLEWRKDNLNTIPPDLLAAKEFYLSRISNFIFENGTRMFVV